MLKDLPQRDRAGHVRRQGSVVIVNMEALTQKKDRKSSADATVAGISIHPPSGRPRAARVYLQNRLQRRENERRPHESVRERQYVTDLFKTLVSPTSGSTRSSIEVTTNGLQGW